MRIILHRFRKFDKDRLTSNLRIQTVAGWQQLILYQLKHSFFTNIVFFKVILSMITKFLISALFSTCNVLRKIENVMMVLWYKGSLKNRFGFKFYKNLCLHDEENTWFNNNFLPNSHFFFETIILSLCLYFKQFQPTCAYNGYVYIKKSEF